jgi:hypothetical protein
MIRKYSITVVFAIAASISVFSNASEKNEQVAPVFEEYRNINSHNLLNICEKNDRVGVSIASAVQNVAGAIYKVQDKEKDIYDWVSLVVSVLSFLITAFAAGYAYWQYSEAKKEGRRCLAHQIYADFLKMAYENPKFFAPNSNEKIQLLANTDDENRRYKIFIANMLYAFEQIYPLIEEGQNKDWEALMEKLIVRHGLYLDTHFSDDENMMWNSVFHEFVKSCIEKYKRNLVLS